MRLTKDLVPFSQRNSEIKHINLNKWINYKIMSLREKIKRFVPMSSRTLTSRLDSILAELRTLEDNDREMKRHLSELETENNELKKLLYYHLDPKLYPHAIGEWYKDETGNVLDLENPKTYNEKIQWMKVFDHDPRKTMLADKLLVRDWVKKKIGEEYLIPLLAVYRRADEIDFSALPDSFVLKANHGSAMNIIVRNKAEANLDEVRSRAGSWLSKNFAFSYGYELHYSSIPRRLIVEEYLENADGDIPDYKFWCFDGKCKMICYICGRKEDPHMAFYDTQWKKLPFYYGYPQIQKDISKPNKLLQMLKIAEILAEGFPHVRVDLYELDNGDIKFGEMTFSSASGTCRWNPPEADQIVGEWFHLPEQQNTET